MKYNTISDICSLLSLWLQLFETIEKVNPNQFWCFGNYSGRSISKFLKLNATWQNRCTCFHERPALRFWSCIVICVFSKYFSNCLHEHTINPAVKTIYSNWFCMVSLRLQAVSRIAFLKPISKQLGGDQQFVKAIS